MVMKSGAGDGLDLDVAIKDRLTQISGPIDIRIPISMLKSFSSINLNKFARNPDRNHKNYMG